MIVVDSTAFLSSPRVAIEFFVNRSSWATLRRSCYRRNNRPKVSFLQAKEAAEKERNYSSVALVLVVGDGLASGDLSLIPR